MLKYRRKQKRAPFESSFSMEAWAGIEPANTGFADPCLTTWLPRHGVRPPRRTGHTPSVAINKEFPHRSQDPRRTTISLNAQIVADYVPGVQRKNTSGHQHQTDGDQQTRHHHSIKRRLLCKTELLLGKNPYCNAPEWIITNDLRKSR